MGAYQNLDVARSQVGKNLFSLLSLYDACEQFHPDIHSLQEVADGLQMLLGKNFGRCHHTCLITVIQCNEHGHEGHERLARTHITLQKTVHLSAAAHIGSDFMHHPFLGACQFKRQMMGIEPVENIGDAVEDIAPELAALVGGIPYYIKLHIEEFLKFKAYLCFLHLLMGMRIMNHADGCIARNQMQTVYDMVWQRFGKRRKDGDQLLGHLLYGT